MNKTIKECALILAKDFMEFNTSEKVFWAPHDEEIRLVEISRDISDIMEILPFRFCEHPDIPYKSLLVIMSPNDWQAVLDKTIDFIPDYFKDLELLMDNGWNKIFDTE